MRAALWSLGLALALAGCAHNQPVLPVEPAKVQMPPDVRAPCDPLPADFHVGMTMGDLYSATDALIGLYGECALRDASKARWAESQGL